MELVEGETLEARVRREGPMPLALALEVIEQAARALAAAEACGVAHRDIKPSNIMLESDAAGTLVVKVIDYGIAKVMAAETERGAEQTQTGFIGTPAFASPEQFAPSEQTKIDTRSDIYSLGVTFWYCSLGVCLLLDAHSKMFAPDKKSRTRRAAKGSPRADPMCCITQVDVGPGSERSPAVCAPTTFSGPPLLHKIQHGSTFAPEAIYPSRCRSNSSSLCNRVWNLAV